MKEIHLIYNPTSGKGSAAAAFDKIKDWAKSQTNVNFIFHATENIGHATSITRDLTSGSNPVSIFVLGGDGTLSEVLNGVVNFEQTTIGILPFGSGNDFVKALGIKNPDPLELVSFYVNNPKVRKIDYLLLNDKYRAINEVGLGMSAEVISYRDKMKHFKPATQYKIATVVRALLWKKFSYTIKVDNGEPRKVDSMWFTMNNGTTVGGGMVTDPDAIVDDGLISVSFVKNFNRLKTLTVLTKCKKGKITALKENERFTCKEIELTADNATVEFDGNLIQNQNTINVKIIPGKLNILEYK